MSEGDPDLAEQLREAIRRSGLSQRDLARRAKIGQAQLSRFLRGERSLTLTAAGPLCAVLGLRLVKVEGAGTEGAARPSGPESEAKPTPGLAEEGPTPERL